MRKIVRPRNALTMIEGGCVDIDGIGGTARNVEDWVAIRPDFDPTNFSIMMHMTRVGFLVARVSGRAAKRHGINRADARLLMTIRGNLNGSALRPSMLGERLDLTRATITYRMDRLIEKGLAEQTSDAKDKRAFNVRLTDAGRTVVDDIMTEISAVFAEKIAGVDAMMANREQMRASLTAFVAHWEATTEEEEAEA